MSNEFREVTMDERKEMMRTGMFDVNGNMPFHPGYTGIHRLEDGSFYLYSDRSQTNGRAATSEESAEISQALEKRKSQK
jgi:hypothetical protein